MLSREAERDAARHEDGEPGSGRQQPRDNGRRVDYLLEISRTRSISRGAEIRYQRLHQFLARSLLDAERLSDGGRHTRGIQDVAQRDEVHAIGESVQYFGASLKREPGFPRAAWAGEGQEPHLALPHHPRHCRHPPLPADEHGRLGREIRGSGIECRQGREARREAGSAQLVDVLGAYEILEPVLAQVEKRHVRWKLARHQLFGGAGHQRLAAMPGRKQSRYSV